MRDSIATTTSVLPDPQQRGPLSGAGTWHAQRVVPRPGLPQFSPESGSPSGISLARSPQRLSVQKPTADKAAEQVDTNPDSDSNFSNSPEGKIDSTQSDKSSKTTPTVDDQTRTAFTKSDKHTSGSSSDRTLTESSPNEPKEAKLEIARNRRSVQSDKSCSSSSATPVASPNASPPPLSRSPSPPSSDSAQNLEQKGMHPHFHPVLFMAGIPLPLPIQATAVTDYTARNAEELSVIKGEHVKVYNLEDPAWCVAVKAFNLIGLLPRSVLHVDT